MSDDSSLEGIGEAYERVLREGAYKELTGKVAFRLKGNPLKLLQGISSNDAHAPVNAFLNRFGVLVILFNQFKVNEQEFLIVFERQFTERFLEHARTHLKLSRTTAKEEPSLKAFHVIGRTQAPASEISIPQRIGFLNLSDQLPFALKEMSDAVYECFRVEHGISVQGVDFDREMLLNTNWQDAVSFTKGCFLGQEVMARVHNLGKPPKRLVSVASQEKVERVMQGGEVAGKVTSACYSPRLKKHVGFACIPNNEKKLDNAEVIT